MATLKRLMELNKHPELSDIDAASDRRSLGQGKDHEAKMPVIDTACSFLRSAGFAYFLKSQCCMAERHKGPQWPGLRPCHFACVQS